MYKTAAAAIVSLTALMSAATAQEATEPQNAADECVINEYINTFNQARDAFISGDPIDMGLSGEGTKIFCEDKTGEETTRATDHLTSGYTEILAIQQ